MTTSNKMKGKVGKIGAASQKKIDIEQFVYLKWMILSLNKFF